MERNLVLLGATGLEDKLQIGVIESIKFIKGAGIKFWIITGDKIETSKRIALSANLLSEATEFFDFADPKEITEEHFNSLRRRIVNKPKHQ